MLLSQLQQHPRHQKMHEQIGHLLFLHCADNGTGSKAPNQIFHFYWSNYILILKQIWSQCGISHDWGRNKIGSDVWEDKGSDNQWLMSLVDLDHHLHCYYMLCGVWWTYCWAQTMVKENYLVKQVCLSQFLAQSWFGQSLTSISLAMVESNSRCIACHNIWMMGKNFQESWHPRFSMLAFPLWTNNFENSKHGH